MKWQFDKYLILESEQRQKRTALQWVVWLSILVTAVKFLAYAYTHSNAILSDSLESLINLAAGLFTLFSIYYASQPRDAKHPYGHGKIEFMAASLEGLLVFGAGATILIKAMYNLYHPQVVENIDAGIIIIACTTLVHLLLSGYIIKKGKLHGSILLLSDGKRIMTDALSSVALLAGLLIMYFSGWMQVDNILAILAGLFILRTGYKLLKDSVKWLLDAADKKVVAEVTRVLENYDNQGWINVYNLRTSHYGMYLYADCQVIMPRYWELQKINQEIKNAEFQINRCFKEQVELFVQAEPCTGKHCSGCRMVACALRESQFIGRKNIQQTPSQLNIKAAIPKFGSHYKPVPYSKMP